MRMFHDAVLEVSQNEDEKAKERIQYKVENSTGKLAFWAVL